MSQEVKIKKVRPYPFSVLLFSGTPTPLRGQVHKLTQIGFIVEMANHQLLHINDKYEAEFEIPVMSYSVKEPVVVVKFYDQYRAKPGGPHETYRLYEIHFRSLKEKHKDEITKFLRHIQQLGS